MCVRVGVCVRACACVQLRVCMRACAYVCVCACVHLRERVCMCACASVCVCVCVRGQGRNGSNNSIFINSQVTRTQTSTPFFSVGFHTVNTMPNGHNTKHNQDY